MPTISLATLSDRELLDETARVVARARQTTAELLELLAEVDTRRLYLGQGYSSLFTYCTQALFLSEPAAYGRITAARAARRFPVILSLMADGDVTLTTISLLSGHLTDENHEDLLEAARHKGKRDVEQLIACLYNQPDIPSSVRTLPPPTATIVTSLVRADGDSHALSDAPTAEVGTPDSAPTNLEPSPTRAQGRNSPSRSSVAPLAADRYLLKVTITSETHDRLARARDLLRHQIPDGDLAAIVDRALIVLVEQLEKTRFAASHLGRPRGAQPRNPRGRHVPAAVKRAVWARDESRCTFVGGDGRCRETGFLEFHHVVPFAVGGLSTTENLELRCRAHNGYEAERAGLTLWRGHGGLDPS